MHVNDYTTFCKYWNARKGEPHLNADESTFVADDFIQRDIMLEDFNDFDLHSILTALSAVTKAGVKVNVANVVKFLDYGTVNPKELETVAFELWNELLENYHACTDIIFGDLRAAVAFYVSFRDFENFTDCRWDDLRLAEKRFVQAYTTIRASKYKKDPNSLSRMFVPCGSRDRSVCAVGDKSVAKTIADKVFGENNYRCVNAPAVTMSRAQYLQCLNNFEQDIHPGNVPTSAKLGGKDE